MKCVHEIDAAYNENIPREGKNKVRLLRRGWPCPGSLVRDAFAGDGWIGEI